MLAAVIGLLVVDVMVQVRLTASVEGCYPELVSQEPKITVAYTMLRHPSPGVAEPKPSVARDTSEEDTNFCTTDVAAKVKRARAFKTEAVGRRAAPNRDLQLATIRPSSSARAARSSGVAREDRRVPLVHARPCLPRRHARQNGKGQWRVLAAVIGLLVVDVMVQVRLTASVEGCYPEPT